MAPATKSRRLWRGGVGVGNWADGLFYCCICQLKGVIQHESSCFLGQFGIILVLGSGAGWKAKETLGSGRKKK